MAADGKIHFRCPNCNKGVSVAEAHAGKRGKCLGCGQPVQVRAAEPALDFDALLDQCMEELRIKTAWVGSIQNVPTFTAPFA